MSHSFFELWLVSCFLSWPKPCSHHLRPSNFGSYNNPQYTSPLNSRFTFFWQAATQFSAQSQLSHITSFKSQKLISKTCSSTENYSFPNYFITGNHQYSLTSKYSSLGKTLNNQRWLNPILFPLLSPYCSFL